MVYEVSRMLKIFCDDKFIKLEWIFDVREIYGCIERSWKNDSEILKFNVDETVNWIVNFVEKIIKFLMKFMLINFELHKRLEKSRENINYQEFQTIFSFFRCFSFGFFLKSNFNKILQIKTKFPQILLQIPNHL